MLASEFVAAVRRQAALPADILDADVLAAGDIEVQARLVPLIRAAHNEYFVSELQVTSYNGRVALPPRSIAGAVRHVQQVVGGITQRLPMVALEDDAMGVSGGLPTSWYFDGGGIVLLPRGTDGTVRLRYYLRPSKMVLETDAAKVWLITVATQSSGGYALAVSGTLPSSGLVDVVSVAASHELDAVDVTPAGGSSLTITQAALLNAIRVGSYVAVAGYSPFVPLPEELAAALVHQVACALLRGLGYDSEAGAQQRFADAAMGAATTLLAPRSEGNPKKRRGGMRKALRQR